MRRRRHAAPPIGCGVQPQRPCLHLSVAHSTGPMWLFCHFSFFSFRPPRCPSSLSSLIAFAIRSAAPRHIFNFTAFAEKAPRACRRLKRSNPSMACNRTRRHQPRLDNQPEGHSRRRFRLRELPSGRRFRLPRGRRRTPPRRRAAARNGARLVFDREAGQKRPGPRRVLRSTRRPALRPGRTPTPRAPPLAAAEEDLAGGGWRWRYRHRRRARLRPGPGPCFQEPSGARANRCTRSLPPATAATPWAAHTALVHLLVADGIVAGGANGGAGEAFTEPLRRKTLAPVLPAGHQPWLRPTCSHIDPSALTLIGLLGCLSGVPAVLAIVWSKTLFVITLMRLVPGRLGAFIWFIIITMNLFIVISIIKGLFQGKCFLTSTYLLPVFYTK